jgi:hypothetical protein
MNSLNLAPDIHERLITLGAGEDGSVRFHNSDTLATKEILVDYNRLHIFSGLSPTRTNH